VDAAGTWILIGCAVCAALWIVVRMLKFRGSDKWPSTDGTVEGEAEFRSAEHGYYGVVKYSYIAGGERSIPKSTTATASSSSISDSAAPLLW